MNRAGWVRVGAQALRMGLASDTLPQAIGRGRTVFTGEGFERHLEALLADPTDDEAWQAACAEWALYGELLREKAWLDDPRD